MIYQLISVLWAFQFDYSIILFRISAAAASTLEELKTQTRAGLEHSISQRKVRDRHALYHYVLILMLFFLCVWCVCVCAVSYTHLTLPTILRV